jgi:hypothetical protein
MLRDEHEAALRWRTVEQETNEFIAEVIEAMAAEPASRITALPAAPQLPTVFASRTGGNLTPGGRVVRRSGRG